MQLFFWSVIQKEAAEQIDGLLPPPEVKLVESTTIVQPRCTCLHTIMVFLPNAKPITPICRHAK